MKKNDIILIIIVLLISLTSLLTVQIIQAQNELTDGVAVVIYDDEEILHIHLEDGTYTILNNTHVFEDEFALDDTPKRYVVRGDYDSSLGRVIIGYENHKVRVLDEHSPQNICQKQGETNSPMRPLTCLPNNVVIVIRSSHFDPDDDDTQI